MDLSWYGDIYAKITGHFASDVVVSWLNIRHLEKTSKSTLAINNGFNHGGMMQLHVLIKTAFSSPY